MPFDGSGNFTRTDGTRTGNNAWDQARQADIDVNSQDHDHHDQDIVEGLELAVLRDGQNSPTANLPMNNFRHTGVSDATENDQYSTLGQLNGATNPFVSAANVGGTANAIQLSPTVAITGHTTGRGFSFIVETENSAAVTVAISGLAAVGLKRSDGTDIDSGELAVGIFVQMVYDGSVYRALNIHPAAAAAEDFDLDADTVRASPNNVQDDDEILIGDDSSTGTPNRKVTAAILADYMETEVRLDAARTVSGQFGENRIPGLNANKITSGNLDAARLPAQIPQANLPHDIIETSQADLDNLATYTAGALYVVTS